MIYKASTELPVAVQTAFDYHERPGCLERLIPPWQSVSVERTDNSLTVGSQVVLKLKVAGVPLHWVAEHTAYEPPHRFADTQVSGPFAAWNHEHQFLEIADGTRSCLTDLIEYELPAGRAGETFGASFAESMIESMFAYRHRVTADDLILASKYSLPPLRIALSGSSGLVGSSLCRMLTLLGHHVVHIVRSPSDDPNSLAVWSSEQDAAQLADVDAVVHLAGKPIAGSRWTDEVKQEIRDSRVDKTRQLCESLASLDRRPRVLICASATGIYGDRGDESLTETSAVGDDFLASVASQWEHACQPAADAGIRIVNTRFGIVLSPQGGALEKMLLPAKLFGGALGPGDQWWSWIALDDVIGAIYHALCTEQLSGPVNFVAPTPLHNRDFAATLGEVLGRPALIPAPAAIIRLALGEMADALLLASTRVLPERLVASGYEFRFTELDDCLRYSLGKQRLPSTHRATT